MKFRKKPVVIEAEQLFGMDSALGIINWSEGMIGLKERSFKDPIELCIPTLEGTMTAKIGDWIIKGVNGEFYPCKPDIFKKTYEPVEENNRES